jgi:hypothetical protein
MSDRPGLLRPLGDDEATQKVGWVKTCKLGKRGLKAEAEWIEAHRKHLRGRFDAWDQVISEIKTGGKP